MRLDFEASELDSKNWVVDFGSFDKIKTFLKETFDHKLIVAEDDPERDALVLLHAKGLAQVVFVQATGCEKFAEMIYGEASLWLNRYDVLGKVRLVSVEVREHGGNGASYGS